MLKKLIKFFVVNLVDRADLATITEVDNNGKFVIEIHVAPQDLAKIIGKEGRTFRALKSIISIVNTGPRKDLVVDTISEESK